MSNDFLKKISRYISENHLLEKDGNYLVALSGGADSVALLYALHTLHFHVEAVHCNFHLRGYEADRDEAFCESLCTKLNVSLHKAHFDTLSFAHLRKISVEMAARELRYNYFEKLRKDLSFSGICVGHHKNDSAETTLFNLVRGTGINGLTGISPVNGFVIRPFLCVEHDEIITFLQQIGQKYVIDSSNLSSEYTRNKLRLEVFPLLKDINPSVIQAVSSTEEHLSQAAQFIQHTMQNVVKNIIVYQNEHRTVIDIASLIQYKEDVHFILWNFLQQYGFNSLQIKEIYNHIKQEKTACWLSDTHELLHSREQFILKTGHHVAMNPLRIPEPGIYRHSNMVVTVCKSAVPTSFNRERASNREFIDSDNIIFPLTLRHYNRGDRFIPLGMKGQKLVSDFLTDSKKNLFEKQEQLVLADAQGKILWLVGERIDHRVRITANTHSCLLLEISNDKS